MTIPEATGIIALLITLLSTAGSALMFFSSRKGANISSLKTLSETVKNLSEQVSELERERERDTAQIRELESLLFLCVTGLQVLTGQLLKLDIEPSWKWPSELTEWLSGKQ